MPTAKRDNKRLKIIVWLFGEYNNDSTVNFVFDHPQTLPKSLPEKKGIERGKKRKKGSGGRIPRGKREKIKRGGPRSSGFGDQRWA